MKNRYAPYDRGFTEHEHLYAFNLINMNGRVYDPFVSRFLSPDSYIQAPDFSQSFNRYAYVWNNPMKYTDPSGEFIIEAMIIGAFINTATQLLSGNVNSAGDFFLSAGIGALSGLAGGVAGQAAAGAVGIAGTTGGAIANGAIVGAASGSAGGFVGGAGNAWVGGANFIDGLGAGIKSGVTGAVGGAVIGGTVAGYKFQRKNLIFRRGCVELGVEPTDPVPATDDFLNRAQKVWYREAPMDKVARWTTENVPSGAQQKMDAAGAYGSTAPLTGQTSGNYTGRSIVYFNKNLAFSSAKRLFFTMGHELMHVSQFALLEGVHKSIMTESFENMMEYHAYSYEHSLGGKKYGSFPRDEIVSMMESYPQYFNKFSSVNFPWTSNHSFIYPLP